MKHILPLTYEPKIPDVRSGKCTQTIRPISYTKPKQVNDLIMFHGWSGKPYRSKWSFRTPYWRIIKAFDIRFKKKHIENRIILRKANGNYIFHDLSNEEMNKMAFLDGFKNIEDMITEFYEMYGEKIYQMIFTVIRWNPIIGEMMEKMPFCWNSRRWVLTMDLAIHYPETCRALRNVGDCDPEDCGYCELREPTKYLLRKMKILGMIN